MVRCSLRPSSGETKNRPSGDAGRLHHLLDAGQVPKYSLRVIAAAIYSVERLTIPEASRLPPPQYTPSRWEMIGLGTNGL